MPAYFTPQEFQEYLEDSLAERVPHVMEEAVRQATQRRFPPLATVSADAYPLPVNVAFFLYQTMPGQHGEVLRAALGSPQTARYWKRLAALASFACTATDWRTLGELALALDFAVTAEGDIAAKDAILVASNIPRQTGTPKRDSRERLIKAWCEYFQDLAMWRSSYFVQVALGYFQALPAGLALPPELVFGEESETTAGNSSWPLLRQFWNNHHLAWKDCPESLSQLETCPNPLLRDLTARIRRFSGGPPEVPEDHAEIAEPFTGFAGDELHRLTLPPLSSPPPITGPLPPRRSPFQRRRTKWGQLWDSASGWVRHLFLRRSRRS